MRFFTEDHKDLVPDRRLSDAELIFTTSLRPVRTLFSDSTAEGELIQLRTGETPMILFVQQRSGSHC